MKLSVVGLGQCGSNIADTFYSVNSYSKSFFNRKIEILTDAFAVNTDEADLGGFKHILKNKSHRILIGTMATFGHGVGKVNVDAFNIIKSTNSIVIDTILRSSRFQESDAIMVISSCGGGTGSGIIGWVIKSLKERIDRPVYAILVLPFAFEEIGETSYAVTNSATCINTVRQHADAMFLFDNERYRNAGSSLAQDLQNINQEIVMNFYDLCCAGEEKRQKYVGSKVMDAGDIKQSLEDISVIGRGEVDLPTFQWRKKHFREGIKEHSLVFTALRQAETKLGMDIDLKHSRKLLLLITAPKHVISVVALEEIFGYLQQKAPKAVIRMGDYPRRGKEISVTLVASQLTEVTRLEPLFFRAERLFKNQEDISREAIAKVEVMRELHRTIPTLD